MALEVWGFRYLLVVWLVVMEQAVHAHELPDVMRQRSPGRRGVQMDVVQIGGQRVFGSLGAMRLGALRAVIFLRRCAEL